MRKDAQFGESPPRARTSWWARLVSALLLAVIAVLGVLLASAGREASALQKERTQLRAEAGHLVIADPNKIYAVQIPTRDPYEWAWRIYLPPNHAYQQFNYQGRMPDPARSRDPELRQARRAGGGSSGSIESGEFVFRIKLEQGPNGQWITKTIKSRGGGSMGQKPKSDWLAKRDWQETSDIPRSGQREFPADAAFEVLRLRNESAVDVNDPTGIADTRLVWISGKPPTEK